MKRRALHWCRETAGRRIHGTTRCIPLEVFEAEEKAALLPLRPERFVIPTWSRCTVHPDHHIRFDYALYSAPTKYVGKEVDVRADGAIVRIYYDAELIKTHAQQPRGGRATDYEDYPKDRAPYAMRYPDFYRKKAREVGPSVGGFADRLLAGEFPWSRLRQAQKLLRLAERYGSQRTDAACRRTLSFDLIDVYRLERILTLALEKETVAGGEFQFPMDRKDWLHNALTLLPARPPACGLLSYRDAICKLRGLCASHPAFYVQTGFPDPVLHAPMSDCRAD
jgi:hypothetical protein